MSFKQGLQRNRAILANRRWVDASGKMIPFDQLRDSHLTNILLLFERNDATNDPVYQQLVTLALQRNLDWRQGQRGLFAGRSDIAAAEAAETKRQEQIKEEGKARVEKILNGRKSRSIEI